MSCGWKDEIEVTMTCAYCSTRELENKKKRRRKKRARTAIITIYECITFSRRNIEKCVKYGIEGERSQAISKPYNNISVIIGVTYPLSLPIPTFTHFRQLSYVRAPKF